MKAAAPVAQRKQCDGVQAHRRQIAPTRATQNTTPKKSMISEAKHNTKNNGKIDTGWKGLP